MSSSLPKTYKAWVVESAGAPMSLRDRPLTLPGPYQVLVKVRVCGVCHSDVAMSSGGFGDVFPRVPGHELVGDVVAVGDKVSRFSNGDRVGGAWHGGHDQQCRQCQRGQFQMCDNCVINGLTQDGGYAQYALLREEAVVRVPSHLDPADVAPLLCAGLTVFNSIRKMHIEQGNLVAVQGVGGLGHLAIQYASRMGYKVAVLSSGSAKEDFSIKLGAHLYVDSSTVDPVKKLQELGGAALIIATAPNANVISPLTAALQPGGKLCVLAPVGPLEINSIDLIVGGRSVCGWPTGHALDAEETIEFSATHGVKCMVERFSMDKAQEASQHMIDNKVRFRSVLVMDQ